MQRPTAVSRSIPSSRRRCASRFARASSSAYVSVASGATSATESGVREAASSKSRVAVVSPPPVAGPLRDARSVVEPVVSSTSATGKPASSAAAVMNAAYVRARTSAAPVASSSEATWSSARGSTPSSSHMIWARNGAGAPRSSRTPPAGVVSTTEKPRWQRSATRSSTWPSAVSWLRSSCARARRTWSTTSAKLVDSSITVASGSTCAYGPIAEASSSCERPSRDGADQRSGFARQA